MRLGGVLGGSWVGLGRVLGPSWGRLGSLGASWERLWRGSAKNPFLSSKFSAPWGRLGASWGTSWARLGAVLGGLGRNLGAKMGPKIDQKTDQKLEATSRSIFGVTA